LGERERNENRGRRAVSLGYSFALSPQVRRIIRRRTRSRRSDRCANRRWPNKGVSTKIEYAGSIPAIRWQLAAALRRGMSAWALHQPLTEAARYDRGEDSRRHCVAEERADECVGINGLRSEYCSGRGDFLSALSGEPQIPVVIPALNYRGFSC
jgi:hypothetical protein